jgi:hypothetical protein
MQQCARRLREAASLASCEHVADTRVNGSIYVPENLSKKEIRSAGAITPAVDG